MILQVVRVLILKLKSQGKNILDVVPHFSP